MFRPDLLLLTLGAVGVAVAQVHGGLALLSSGQLNDRAARFYPSDS